jgi:hypothetical protein
MFIFATVWLTDGKCGAQPTMNIVSRAQNAFLPAKP